MPLFALAVVEDDSALPASLLVMVEFAQVGDDVLARPRFGAHALDQSVVGVRLAVFGPGVPPQEHGRLLVPQNQERMLNSRRKLVTRSSLHAVFGGFHYEFAGFLGDNPSC